jgi:hypothetical protein
MNEIILFIGLNYSRKQNGHEGLALDSLEADPVSIGPCLKIDLASRNLTSDKIKL